MIDSHFLIFMRLSSINDDYSSNLTTYVCYPLNEKSPNYYYFLAQLWPWIDLFLYSCIPFTIMIFSTAIIIYKLCKTTNTTNINSNNNNKNDQNETAKRRRNNQVCKLLITLNTTFFILVTPLVFSNSTGLIVICRFFFPY